MDETYIKVKGEWVYYYRAVDKQGQTVDFFLSQTHDTGAAQAFFAKAIGSSGQPEKVNMDKSGANLSGLMKVNGGLPENKKITLRQVKYLIEQDHRGITRITKPMLGFKSFVGGHISRNRIVPHDSEKSERPSRKLGFLEAILCSRSIIMFKGEPRISTFKNLRQNLSFARFLTFSSKEFLRKNILRNIFYLTTSIFLFSNSRMLAK